MKNQEHDKIKKIDDLIGQLPQNFPEAAEVIKNDIIQLLVDCDKGIIDHYCTLIKKRTNAASKKAITKLIDEAILKIQSAETPFTYDDGCQIPTSETLTPDPEIVKAAVHMSQDPQLFRKKIDLVNKLGVAGERKNIALTLITIDSRLLTFENGKPENLGLKNSGHQGSGKSNTMMKSLKIYPETAYHTFSNVSPKGLLMMADELKHKAVIFSEGKAFEARGKNDPDQAYVVRSLLSEGSYEYQRQVKTSEGWATEYLKLEGPISLLTTTIKEGLEQQLDDRILTIYTDTSTLQTSRVLKQLAANAAGVGNDIDGKIIETWQYFHDLLDPMQVVIPFSMDLLYKLPDNPPVAARRSFGRVITTIKAMAVLHQAQRKTNETDQLIAEYADYAMAYQLIETSFAESLKDESETTESRVEIIKTAKRITPGALAKKAGVSSPAISHWIESTIKKGLVTWCDENGKAFDDISALKTAKHSGIAYIRIVTGKSLPTPYELTGDPRWDKDGDLYALYDLHLETEGPVDEGWVNWELRLIANDNQAEDEVADEIPDKAMIH